MKKQFFRVKQLADQTFLRAEKSEVLNHEELQIADQKTEVLRSAITSIMKKIAPIGPANDIEKLMKKCFEYQLGSSFIEESKPYQECQLFQQILKEAGIIEQQLAREYAEHEIKVEEMVYSPLQSTLENEFPNIMKHKHNLRKYCLDKDSASNRYNATRKETLKEDMEEADTKVEQNRDVLAIEMFNLLAKENEFSGYILQLLKLQRGYHESALKNLEAIIPSLESKIGNSPVRRVFGTTLKEHLRITGKRIAYPLEICIPALSEYGMLEEGLFRVAGSATKVKRLKSAIDSGCFSWLIPEYRDAHVLASTLKLYLRELPEPLLTFELHKEWLEAMQYPENQRLKIIKSIIEKLPQENKDNLCYLLHFLFKFTQHPENKMSPSNIAIVLSPSLLWTKNENDTINIGNCVVTNMLLELFIKEAQVLFPDDVSKYVISKLNLDEEIPNHNTYGDPNLSFKSPKPSVRKKKFAPIPPNSEPIITFSSKLPDIKQIESKPDFDIRIVESNRYTHIENIPKNEQNLNQDIRACREGNNVFSKEGFVDNVNCQSTIEEPENSGYPKGDSGKMQYSENINEKMKVKDGGDQHIVSSIKSDDTTEHTSEEIKKSKVINRALKPQVPARPSSISFPKKIPSSVTCKKTHCSVYNVADKLQPSIINIEKEIPPDNLRKDIPNMKKNNFFSDLKQIHHKDEKSEFCDPNICDDDKKAKLISTPDYSDKEINSIQLCNHVRAKSDGGIADINKTNNKLVQPPSLEI